MSTLAFEDVHKHDGEVHYVVPNEHVGIWIDLVEPLKIERAAAICSSGEVGFFSILPTVTQELVLVDHSYRSLAVAMLKYLVMRDMGATKAKELFASRDTEKIKAEFAKAAEKLPTPILEAYNRLARPRDYGGLTSPGNIKNMGTEWEAAPKPALRKAVSKLDKVAFLHGDLRDLAAKGPFDLIYLSNALEHMARDRKKATAADVAKAVKPGGYALIAKKLYPPHTMGNKQQHPEGWEVVKSIKATYDGMDPNKIDWDHILYKLPEAA